MSHFHYKLVTLLYKEGWVTELGVISPSINITFGLSRVTKYGFHRLPPVNLQDTDKGWVSLLAKICPQTWAHSMDSEHSHAMHFVFVHFGYSCIFLVLFFKAQLPRH